MCASVQETQLMWKSLFSKFKAELFYNIANLLADTLANEQIKKLIYVMV